MICIPPFGEIDAANLTGVTTERSDWLSVITHVPAANQGHTEPRKPLDCRCARTHVVTRPIVCLLGCVERVTKSSKCRPT